MAETCGSRMAYVVPETTWHVDPEMHVKNALVSFVIF